MKQALQQAYDNISKVPQSTKPTPIKVETQPGVVCEQVTRPHSKSGLVRSWRQRTTAFHRFDAGCASKIAVVAKVVLCSPPPIADEILYVAKLCNIDEVITSVVDKRWQRWLTERKRLAKSIKYLVRVMLMSPKRNVR